MATPFPAGPRPWFKDAAERVAATFVQAALGYLSTVALPDGWDPSAKLVFGAVVAALIAALKAWVAKHVGDPDSASLVA